MFGYHAARRQEKRAARAINELKQKEKSYSKTAQEKEKQAAEQQKTQVDERAKQAAKDREEGYAKGRARAEELFSRDVQGLDPAKRQAMQYEANQGIQRSMQSAGRKLLGEQAQHGIVGKGGVGYAQQRDLLRLGNEAQAGVHRDLDKLNSDLALKKLAAMFNIEQGEASQTQLDKQLAVDELQLADERKRQRMFEDQFNRLFSRV